LHQKPEMMGTHPTEEAELPIEVEKPSDGNAPMEQAIQLLHESLFQMTAMSLLLRKSEMMEMSSMETDEAVPELLNLVSPVQPILCKEVNESLNVEIA